MIIKGLKRCKYLHLIFILIITYAYQDFKNSTNIGMKNAERGTIHIILFVLIIMLSIYFIHTLFSQSIKKDSVEKSLWLIAGWILIVGIFQGSSIWLLLVHLGLSVLWALVYHFGRDYLTKNFIMKTTMFKWIVVLFIFYVFSFLYASNNIKSIYGTTPVLNLVYYLIIFYPWLSFLSSIKLKNIINVIIVLAVLFSFKRGAIIIFPLMIITFIIVNAKIKNRKISGAIKIIFLIIIFILFVVIANNFSGGIIFDRFTAEALTSGSGRNDIYSLAIYNIKNRGFLDLMIGLGSGSSVKYLGTSAHNEWIEFAFSYGLIGVLLYVKLFISLIIRGIIYIKERSKYAPAYASMLIYMIIIGLFGGLYFVHSTLYVMMFLGVIEGCSLREKP